ncbi:larval cuticle protein A2B-like [Diachasma alloeum]|uniref:larval cuticle protein A2B-like n=1 Tax=Diachasma alloeum TaxID=454923 RepID=UPI0010FADA3D|nr:larval cuticle protein A2B-like [Diachasma alloeum]
MAFKFIVLAAFLAVGNAGVLPAYHVEHSAPLVYAQSSVVKVDAEYDAHPEYTFSYGVHDSLTGDAKTQEESRNGDKVEGSYSLVEADGSKRIVHYTADDHNGFNAVVEKQPAVHSAHVVHAAPVVPAAPVVIKSAPVYHAEPAYKIAAPVAHSYSAPLVHSYSAPVAHAYSVPVAHAYAPALYHH